MTALKKGIVLATLQCALVLSLTGNLLYDRSTRPSVWVKTAPWDPNLPIRGRYLSLRLIPEAGVPYFEETNQQRVAFFVPERQTEVEAVRSSDKTAEIWAEVTIPRKGPPRPIRLGIKKDGQIRIETGPSK